jgi:hypothetical protein
MNPRFLAIVADTRLIPGVHHYCDEWCDHCHVTARCLAYRCTEEWRKGKKLAADDPTFASHEEAIAFTRDVAEVEGTTTEELDALLSAPPGESGIRTDDPLAELAWHYSIAAAALLAQLASRPATAEMLNGEPPAVDVVLWYHLRIYMRVFRALVARERTAAGKAHRDEEALGNAKLVLVSVRRSRAALPALRSPDTATLVTRLEAMLAAIEEGVTDRFPRAEAFVRIGLDVPAAA